MERIVKLLFAIAVFVFLIMTLYVYAFLPEQFTLEGEYFSFQTSKEIFFYSSIGAFIVLNLLASFFTSTLKKIPSREGSFYSLKKKDQFVVLSSSLKLIISIFFILSITFIGMSQNDEHFDISNFSFLVYIGPILLVIWILSIIFLLLNKK